MECTAAAAGSAQLVCIVLPASNLIIPLISLAAAALAAFMAWQSIQNARDIARRKATLDLIEKTESSEHYRQLIETVQRIDVEELLPHLVDRSEPDLLPERGALIDYLNHYELVAISIRNGVLDSDMYRLWMQTAFVQAWNDFAPWVQAIRMRPMEGKPADYYNRKSFQHFEYMAWKWSPDAVWLQPGNPPPLQQTPLADRDKLARVIAARPKAKT